ncbi:hypothetical protein [Lysobacter sp. 1R34A]
MRRDIAARIIAAATIAAVRAPLPILFNLPVRAVLRGARAMSFQGRTRHP